MPLKTTPHKRTILFNDAAITLSISEIYERHAEGIDISIK